MNGSLGPSEQQPAALIDRVGALVAVRDASDSPLGCATIDGPADASGATSLAGFGASGAGSIAPIGWDQEAPMATRSMWIAVRLPVRLWSVPVRS
jgi:hypothetical protein